MLKWALKFEFTLGSPWAVLAETLVCKDQALLPYNERSSADSLSGKAVYYKKIQMNRRIGYGLKWREIETYIYDNVTCRTRGHEDIRTWGTRTDIVQILRLASTFARQWTVLSGQHVFQRPTMEYLKTAIRSGKFNGVPKRDSIIFFVVYIKQVWHERSKSLLYGWAEMHGRAPQCLFKFFGMATSRMGFSMTQLKSSCCLCVLSVALQIGYRNSHRASIDSLFMCHIHS